MLKTSLDRRLEFEKFDRENPEVYWMFEKFTMAAYHAGAKKLGAKMIWERMRWHVRFETYGSDFKLNNNYTSYYAQMFLDKHPDLSGLFDTRGER